MGLNGTDPLIHWLSFSINTVLAFSFHRIFRRTEGGDKFESDYRSQHVELKEPGFEPGFYPDCSSFLPWGVSHSSKPLFFWQIEQC